MCFSSSSSAPVSTITVLDPFDVRIGQRRVADEVQDRSLRAIGPGDGSGEQRRRLALDEVAAHRLARDGGVAERAHHVVAHLEGVAERQAVGAQLRAAGRRPDSGAASTAPRCSGRSIVYLPDL